MIYIALGITIYHLLVVKNLAWEEGNFCARGEALLRCNGQKKSENFSKYLLKSYGNSLAPLFSIPLLSVSYPYAILFLYCKVVAAIAKCDPPPPCPVQQIIYVNDLSKG